ncbi:PREDICTED: uncharacterized protein LOC109169844 [Ipomoea nil]|uniref:uncharacterized protein LOC109169844 n=1 Tax=Ipomoea nil TaxID=35883 RepID=UPI000901F512|nr:PREDICTED: uncharacterized protein LOC109169844 [Ipomoea nil]
MAVQGVLKEGCRRVVGNGVDTIIGLDPWLPDDDNLYVETELHQFVFGAQLASEFLPTRDALAAKRVSCSLDCHMCRFAAESALHLFVNCAEARRVWNLVGVPQLNNYAGDNISDWNESVWKGSVHNSALVVQRALDFLEGWRGANQEHRVNGANQEHRVHWKKPRLGRLKLNTDVSGRQEDGQMGLGWVLRGDDNGGFLAAKNVLVAGTYLVKEAEALCVREALSWLKATGLGRVEVEMDSQLVCNAIRSVSFSSAFGYLVDDVKDLASEIEGVEFYFVKRSVNRAAHSVSREAFSVSGCGEWLDSPPSFLVNFLHSDLMN